MCDDDAPVLHRAGLSWKPIAGFRKSGSIFCIYRGDTTYCVHAGDVWPDADPPLIGYFPLDLSWDELIMQIADRYDAIRAAR